MPTTFELDITGYFRDEVRFQFPHSQGVYFIYKGLLNNVTRTCTLRALLYIGETQDLYNTLNEHPNRKEFIDALEEGESLFYTYALTCLDESDRRRVETSLIYELAPSKNKRSQNNFEYPHTTIKILGDRHAFIPKIVNAPSY